MQPSGRTLVTGAAGFIGAALCQRLVGEGHEVVGIDSLNAYYSRELKKARLKRLEVHERFSFRHQDLTDAAALIALFEQSSPEVVINLAAQVGVRYSLENPRAYVDSNLVGFANLLDACRAYPPKHLIYASSSSVYGGNRKMPFSVQDPVDQPLNLYAASKKANELMAHAYSHLYGFPCTGLRFFTVYGPWGRPDMAPIKFMRAIGEGRTIKAYNQGRSKRDFTFIDDIVESMVRLIPRPAPIEPGNKPPAARVFNIGRGEPVDLMEFIDQIERAMGTTAKIEKVPAQPGEMEVTWADTSDLEQVTGYSPQIGLTQGIEQMVQWGREYYGF